MSAEPLDFLSSAAEYAGRWRFFPRLGPTPQVAVAFVRRDGGGFTSACPACRVPELVEALIERGDIDAARDCAAAWLSLLADKYGMHGLEYQLPPRRPGGG